MKELLATHEQQLAAWHAAEERNATADQGSGGHQEGGGDDGDDDNAAVVDAGKELGEKGARGPSKAAKRRMAKERAEAEHEARVAAAAANGCE